MTVETILRWSENILQNFIRLIFDNFTDLHFAGKHFHQWKNVYARKILATEIGLDLILDCTFFFIAKSSKISIIFPVLQNYHVKLAFTRVAGHHQSISEKRKHNNQKKKTNKNKKGFSHNFEKFSGVI